MPNLNEAIQFINRGRKQEARPILETIIRTEPGNIAAWFWYVETCATIEQRIQVLEVCLKRNPGNPQVVQALQTLKGQRDPKPEFVPPPKPVEKPQPAVTSYPAASIYDNRSSYPYPSDYRDEPEPVQPQPVTNKKPWEQEPDSFVDTSMLSKPKPAARTYSFINAWTTVLFSFDIASYVDVLDDPEASSGRAFEWIAYAGIVNGLLFPLLLLLSPQMMMLKSTPEFSQAFGNIGTNVFMLLLLALVMMIISPLLSMLGLAIGAGIYNFLAGFFGGNGDYGRTAYALAAYMAPIGILNSILMIIPLAGSCLTSLLGLYGLVLAVRALCAAHSLSIGKALGVIFVPIIIMMIFGCILMVVVGMPVLSR
jgi:hypothetical protein